MIIIDGNLIELTNEQGDVFEELNFLPYLNEPVRIKGELTLRKLKIILNDYPILKTIYIGFNIFIEQYNYDEMMKIKIDESIYTKILLKNNFRFQKSNFLMKQNITEKEIINGLRSRIVNIEYEKGDSMAFEMLTTVSLLDNKNSEHSINLVDLKNIVDIPIEIFDGRLNFTENTATFDDKDQFLEMKKDSLNSDLETEISFNEFMLAISEKPDFDSTINKKARKEIEKGKQMLKRIFK